MADPLPIAVQLYTLRDLPGGLPDQLRVASAAGYSAVETVGTHGLAAPELRRQLEAHGLRAVSSHVALSVLRDDLDAAVAFAHAIGNDTLVVPWLPQAERSSDRAGWQRLGEELGEIGARCADEGVRLLYHNHDFEMVELDGSPAIAWLLEAAQEDHLGFEPDIAWIVRGGGEPAALLERFAGRCPRVHVKDLAPAGTAVDEGGWAAVGSGTLDWDRWLRAANAAGAEWYVVEHDAPHDAAATIRESYAFLAASPVLRRD
jgi:sugar phosphate isomerase/epimerase